MIAASEQLYDCHGNPKGNFPVTVKLPATGKAERGWKGAG